MDLLNLLSRTIRLVYTSSLKWGYYKNDVCVSESQHLCIFFFGSHVFQQSVGNPLGTNFAPFLAELFLCSHEAEFIHRRVHEKRDHLIWPSIRPISRGCLFPHDNRSVISYFFFKERKPFRFKCLLRLTVKICNEYLPMRQKI